MIMWVLASLVLYTYLANLHPTLCGFSDGKHEWISWEWICCSLASVIEPQMASVMYLYRILFISDAEWEHGEGKGVCL